MDFEYTEENPMTYEETLDFILDQIDQEFDEPEQKRIEELRLELRKLDLLYEEEEKRLQHEQWKRHANSPYT